MLPWVRASTVEALRIMKHDNLESNDARLRELLTEARPAPALPPRFGEAVWRRIERAESPPSSAPALTWLDALTERWLRPKLVFAGLTALMLVSALAGAVTSAGSAREAAQERYLSAVAPQAIR